MLDYYFHPGLQRWVDDTAANHAIDVVYIFCTAMAPYALHLQAKAKILDMQDVDSEKWAIYARQSRWPARAIWRREARTLLAYERHAVMQCDRTFLVTEEETRRFAELAPETADRLTWVQMGVDVIGFPPTSRSRALTPAKGLTSSSPATWITGRTPMRSFGSPPPCCRWCAPASRGRNFILSEPIRARTSSNWRSNPACT